MKLKSVSADGKKKYHAPVLTDGYHLEEYNNTQNKNCLFFTPNWEFGLSWGERKEANARRVFCLIADGDNGEEFWKWQPFEPSIIVKTKRGFHCYRLLKEPVVYDEKFKNVQKMWIEMLKADPGAQDIARFLRLPWSRYWGDGLWEHTTPVIHYNPEKRYSFQQYLDFFLKLKQVENVNKNTKASFEKQAWSLIDDINTYVPVNEVLETLSNGTYDVLPSWAIKENGEVTSGYKYRRHMNCIVNFTKSKDRPEGWSFAIARKLLPTAKDTFKFFEQQYNLGNSALLDSMKIISERTEKDETGEEKLIEIETGNNQSLIVNKESYETYLEYTTADGIKKDLICSGCIFPVGYYEDGNMLHYVVKYATAQNSWLLVLSELGKPSTFERALSTVGITLFKKWADKATKTLINYIHNVKEKLSFYWALWVFDEVISDHTGRRLIVVDSKKYFFEVSDLGNKEFITPILLLNKDPISIAEAISNLKKMYTPNISLTAFAWYGMSIFSYFVRKQLDFFPILNFVWLTQSGKTTLRRTIMKAYGISKLLEVQAKTSEFVMAKMSKHFLPVNVGEWDAENIKIDWDTYIKNNYDWTKTSRGTWSQQIINYETNAPVAIDGETRSMNNAVFSRSVILFMNPSSRWVKRTPKWTVLHAFLEKKDAIYTLKAEYEKEREEFEQMFAWLDKNEKDRILDNYAALAAFSRIFNLWEEVIEAIKVQCTYQFELLWDNNVDKTIKNIFAMAMMSRMIATYNAKEKTIDVDFCIDVMKYNKSKVDEIKSQIEVVNHHFNMAKWTSDILRVPLQYMMSSTHLHPTLNKMLNYITKDTSFGSADGAKAVIQYAKSNGYERELFATELKHEFNIPNIHDNSMNKEGV